MSEDEPLENDEASLLAKAERLLAEAGNGGELSDEPATAGSLFAGLIEALDGADDSSLDGLAVGAARIGDTIQNVHIIGLLGRGGMGEVYEGVDQLLQRRVAVKALRLGTGLGSSGRSRLLKEARALARLDHPGICRVHGLIEDHDERFLVLELIDGIVLRRATPSITTDDRLRIVEEIADAVAAAHAAGIVHRDLKPDNVMIQPDGRARVMDFGIARWTGDENLASAAVSAACDEAQLSESDTVELGTAEEIGPPDSDATIFPTRTGSILGTVRYMSPEQARGETVTPAADVFSLALILQELLTGLPAHPADSPARQVLMRVAEARVEPPTAVANAEVRRLIEGCTARDPKSRPSASEVAATLRRIRERPHRRRRWAITAAAALFTLVATIFVTQRWLAPPPLLPEGEQPRIAVLPFANETGDASLGWVETGLAEMVAESLAGVEGVSVIPFEQIQKIVLDSGVDEPDQVAAASARHFGTNLALTARVQAAADGSYRLIYTTLRPGSEPWQRTVEHSDLFAAANQLSASLTRRVAPEALLPELTERFSGDPIANRMYAEGIQHLRQEETPAAEPYFRVAMDLDSDFLDAEVRLAECMMYQSRWDQAETIALALVDSTQAQGRADLTASTYEVLATVSHGRDLRPAAAEWGRKAVEAAELSGSSERVANASHTLARTLRYLDREEAKASFTRALELHTANNHRLGRGKALHALGVIADESGDGGEAENLFRQALEVAEDIRAHRLEGIALDSLAIVLSRTGSSHDETLRLLERARALHEGSGDLRAMLFTLNNLGDNYHHLERISEAEAAFRDGEQICAQVEAPNPCALLAFNFAELLLTIGRPEEAFPRIETSEAWYGSEDADLLYTRAMYWMLSAEPARAESYLARAVAGTSPERGAGFRKTYEETRARAAAKDLLDP